MLKLAWGPWAPFRLTYRSWIVGSAAAQVKQGLQAPREEVPLRNGIRCKSQQQLVPPPFWAERQPRRHADSGTQGTRPIPPAERCCRGMAVSNRSSRCSFSWSSPPPSSTLLLPGRHVIVRATHAIKGGTRRYHDRRPHRRNLGFHLLGRRSRTRQEFPTGQGSCAGRLVGKRLGRHMFLHDS